MDYSSSNRAQIPMHHPIGPHPPMHHQPGPGTHALLSNQLQPINSDSHTSMWLDDPYVVSNGSMSQRDSGFNSRPASLRSVDSTVTNTTGTIHNPATVYDPIGPQPAIEHEILHPTTQYTELQPAPAPPARPEPSQVIPELLGLLMEDDPVIVREAVLLTHMLVKEGGESRSEVIRNRDVSL